jgi:hypothetical protein
MLVLGMDSVWCSFHFGSVTIDTGKPNWREVAISLNSGSPVKMILLISYFRIAGHTRAIRHLHMHFLEDSVFQCRSASLFAYFRSNSSGTKPPGRRTEYPGRNCTADHYDGLRRSVSSGNTKDSVFLCVTSSVSQRPRLSPLGQWDTSLL